MSDERLQDIRPMVDVFSDADRLRLIGRLVERSWTATALAAETGMKIQAVARHIRMLDDAGFIVRDVDQPSEVRFDVDHLRSVAARLRPDESDSFPGQSNDDARLLRSFVADGQLIQLPSQRSRWVVVLSWLAEHFKFDRQYSEREVSELLQAIHPDYALLRRQLVDEGFLARDHGVYWRLKRQQEK
jgi:DNA-binding transcriptional ArsR family regulator